MQQNLSPMSRNNIVRLNSYLAQCGFGSRRKCEDLILSGRISVNGKKIYELSTKITIFDIVTLDDKVINPEEKIYIALNKPTGYLCSNSDKYNRPLAMDLFKNYIKYRLFHVGRLDFLSSGLIFYTNDGDFAQIIIDRKFKIEKEYLVETQTTFPDNLLKKFLVGVEINQIHYQIESYRQLTNRKVLLILIEGKNREIRNLFKHFMIKVKSIHRIRIGNVSIQGIKKGEFRYLTEKEVAFFKKKIVKI